MPHRGRMEITMILVIDRHEKNATTFAGMLSYMGVVSVGATPRRALSLISTVYSAVVAVMPSTLADPQDFLKRLRGYADIPIFAIEKEDASDLVAGLVDKIFPPGTSSSSLLSKIREFTKERGLRSPGDYRLSGIDASISRRGVFYFDSPVALTKTETMILRALIRVYPAVSDAKTILSYAFRVARLPDASNIRTHISIINKKWREAFSENIVETSTGDGYRLISARLRLAASVT